MAREYEMLFKLNAQVAGSYNSAFRAAQTEIRTYQKEIQALNTTAANISGFQKQTTAVAEAQKKIELLQQQYDNIQREIQETGTYSSDLENKLISKKNQIDKAGEALQIATDRLETYRKALEDSGVDTDNLEQETRDLQEEIKELRKKQEEAAEGFDDMGEEGTSAAETLKEALVSAGITKILKEITDFLGDCTDAAMGFEHSMAGVRRTVGGTDEFLTELGDSFQDMSTTIPLTTTELGTIAETAGQLGIAQERVEQFTIVMAQLGTTTDLTASDAATMLAQYSNITGVTDYERLGSVVASLGDATATTASKVVDMSLGMAASASIAGFSERDILAVAAAVGSLGIESAAGSTAMSQLISMLYKATETGEKLTEIADIAGMSASEFKTAWGEDAVGAMNTFVQGLTDVERNGKSAIVLLDELGITNVRQVKAILSLAQAGDLLAGTINQANKAWDENTALGQKADIMYSSTQSKLTMMQNSYSNLQIELGENFTPVLQTIYTMANGLFSGVATFVDKAPGATKAIGALTIGGAAFAASLTAIVVVTKAWKVAQDALNKAIEANPYLMTISTIIGVVTALSTLIVTLASAEEEVEQLSATSKAQREEMEALRAEYEAVCEAQGETSADAQLLKRELDEQTESFEQNKQTVQELSEELKNTHDSYVEMTQQYDNAVAGIDAEYDSTLNLIDRLNELTAAEQQSASAKEEILTIVDLLNERIPELGLNYDSLTGKLSMTPEDVIKAASAANNKDKTAADYESLRNRLAEEAEFRSAYEKASAELTAAQKQYSEAQKAYANKRASVLGDKPYATTTEEVTAMANERKAMEDASKALETAKENYSTAQSDYTENQTAIKELSEGLATYREETEAVTYGTDEMTSVSEELIETLGNLQTAYTEAYEAAYESISGQYALWDEVADVSATSVQKTIESIQGQTQYWSGYNSNIETLLKYAPEISGLSEMVASFADGSEESVNMIAGMAGSIKDGDTTALRDMVAAWLDLKTQQQETAESLAELETGIGEETKEIIAHFTNEVEQLNLSDEAKESGMATITGFIEGAESLLPDVSTAFGKVSNAVRTALFGSNTSTGFRDYSPEAYASGTMNAKRGWNWVGEEGPELMWMNGGEVILPADISSHVSAESTLEALPSNGRYGGGTVVHFAPSYQITGSDPDRVEAVLREHDASMRDLIVEVLEDIRSDEERRVYN